MAKLLGPARPESDGSSRTLGLALDYLGRKLTMCPLSRAIDRYLRLPGNRNALGTPKPNGNIGRRLARQLESELPRNINKLPTQALISVRGPGQRPSIVSMLLSHLARSGPALSPSRVCLSNSSELFNLVTVPPSPGLRTVPSDALNRVAPLLRSIRCPLLSGE